VSTLIPRLLEVRQEHRHPARLREDPAAPSGGSSAQEPAASARSWFSSQNRRATSSAELVRRDLHRGLAHGLALGVVGLELALERGVLLEGGRLAPSFAGRRLRRRDGGRARLEERVEPLAQRRLDRRAHARLVHELVRPRRDAGLGEPLAQCEERLAVERLGEERLPERDPQASASSSRSWTRASTRSRISIRSAARRRNPATTW
jgi:hypothetical protein